MSHDKSVSERGFSQTRSAGRRALGTIVTYGYPREHLGVDLEIAHWLGAEVLEILPHWSRYPDPDSLRAQCSDRGLAIHSVHGCWGRQSIRADRVDLAAADVPARQASVDDLRRCLDWLVAAGGRFLIVHPGGLSNPEDQPTRTGALLESLGRLAQHAQSTRTLVCVENMPPGVYPGSSMADLYRLVGELASPHVGLALDTGHARLGGGPEPETRAAREALWSTHVHDNDGRADAHLPPGTGCIDWPSWRAALDAVAYRGPIVLECIRHLRERPESRTEGLRELVWALTPINDPPPAQP